MPIRSQHRHKEIKISPPSRSVAQLFCAVDYTKKASTKILRKMCICSHCLLVIAPMTRNSPVWGIGGSEWTTYHRALVTKSAITLSYFVTCYVFSALAFLRGSPSLPPCGHPLGRGAQPFRHADLAARRHAKVPPSRHPDCGLGRLFDRCGAARHHFRHVRGAFPCLAHRATYPPVDPTIRAVGRVWQETFQPERRPIRLLPGRCWPKKCTGRRAAQNALSYRAWHHR